MTFENKQLTCLNCQRDFLFTVGEQEFFALKQLINVPKRCPDCRAAVKAKREGRTPPTMYEVTCEACGQQAQVAFKPTGKSPVYCTGCFHTKRQKTEVPQASEGM
jgi:CxxC-x17-CxxC domain-containing protein